MGECPFTSQTSCFKMLMKHVPGAGKLVQRVKVPAVMPEDLSLISGAHVVERENQPPKVRLRTPLPSPHKYRHVKSTYITAFCMFKRMKFQRSGNKGVYCPHIIIVYSERIKWTPLLSDTWPVFHTQKYVRSKRAWSLSIGRMDTCGLYNWLFLCFFLGMALSNDIIGTSSNILRNPSCFHCPW